MEVDSCATAKSQSSTCLHGSKPVFKMKVLLLLFFIFLPFVQPAGNASFKKSQYLMGQWRGEATGNIELLIAKHRKMLIRVMLRKALTHQGASLRTLSWDCELLLAKTGERLTWILPRSISCHHVRYCLGQEAYWIVFEVICLANLPSD